MSIKELILQHKTIFTMPYITLPIIFIIGFAIAACIAYIHRGKVRRKKIEVKEGMPYINNLFDTVETFSLEDYIDDTDPFEATELHGHKN